MISVCSKGQNLGYQNDLAGAGLKDISTWTPSGNAQVSLTYENSVNNFTFGNNTPTDKKYTVSFDVNALAPIDAERLIDVLNSTTPFTTCGKSLDKTTTNINAINDLLTVWKTNPEYKLSVALMGTSWATMNLTLYTGTCSITSTRIGWTLKKYSKELYNGNWTTWEGSSEGSISSNQLNGRDFGDFSTFDSEYALPNGNTYLLTMNEKSSTGWTVAQGATADFYSFDELADYLLDHFQNLNVASKSALISELTRNAGTEYNKATNPYKIFILTDESSSNNYVYISIVKETDSLYMDGLTLKSNNLSQVTMLTIGFISTTYYNQNTTSLPLTFNTGYTHNNYIFSINTDVAIGPNVTLTNGSNEYTLEFNNQASNDYRANNIIFTPTVKTSTLKLDLSAMLGNQVDLHIKDISIYEIGGNNE